MGIYLDIDMDYFVKPVIKKADLNKRFDGICSIESIDDFILLLKKRNLYNSRDKKYFTDHRKSYTYWWLLGKRNMTLIHIDAHSDLYKERGRDLRILSDLDLMCDNYIWYALRENFIGEIIWIIPGCSSELMDESYFKSLINFNFSSNESYNNGIFTKYLDVITKYGRKNIKYSITTMDNIPKLNGEVELMTIATSPEFIPKSSDEKILRGLSLLGAGDDDVKRIKKIHDDMDYKENN